jgi:hypothetical protein
LRVRQRLNAAFANHPSLVIVKISRRYPQPFFAAFRKAREVFVFKLIPAIALVIDVRKHRIAVGVREDAGRKTRRSQKDRGQAARFFEIRMKLNQTTDEFQQAPTPVP